MKENKIKEGWWRVVVNNDDCPFRVSKNNVIKDGELSFYYACELRAGQFNDECLYVNCKKRY